MAAGSFAVRSDRFPALSLVACVACVLGLLLLGYPPFRALLLRIEHWTSDWRTTLLSEHITDVHSRIAVVVFNPASYGGHVVTPTPRDLLARVVRAVDGANPLAIGVDFYFVQPTELEKDRDFLDAVNQAGSDVVVGAVNEGAEQFTVEQHEFQRRFASQVKKRVGYINLRHDRDDVVRYVSVPVENTYYPESLALLLAKIAGVQPASLPDAHESFSIAWLWGPHSNPSPFLTIATEALFASDTADKAKKQLTGKIVLIGIDLPYADQHRTPFSVWTGEAARGVMVHAQILSQLLDGRRYHRLSVLGDYVLLSGIGIVAFVLSWSFWRDRADFLGVSSATAVLFVTDAGLYYWAHVILPFTLGLYVWSIGVAGGLYGRRLYSWAMKGSRVELSGTSVSG